LTLTLASMALLAPGCGGRESGAPGGDGGTGGGSGGDGANPGADSSGPPTTTTVLRTGTVDKIDLLFVVDNSASMGDKQAYLAEAVPVLITRLVQPNCLDASGKVVGPSDAQGNGTCTVGTVEFPPVHDMHIGVVTSSLGSRLSDQYGGGSSGTGIVCDPSATLTFNGTTISNHNDDRGELVNRGGAAETPIADLGTLNYLSWFPNNPQNAGQSPSPGAPPIADATVLISDFTTLLTGVGNYGCGIESQLESWYRFLVQPDPYDSLSVDSSARAQWTGVDSTILKQRAAFLRPDSLVAIIDMTDENDSEIDVRSYGGQGYLWMAASFDPPRGTSACNEDANDDGLTDPSTCDSCQLASGASSDPSCMLGPYSADNDWGFNENLRHVHMTQKYGLAPQFPIQRYVLGLTSAKIPDRNGEYPAGATSYQGLTTLDCTNPLFAGSLPDGSDTTAATLCNLPPGPRTPDLVYYAHIGGVPHELLQNPDGTVKETLAATDWAKILGSNPSTFDYTGADPRMIESYEPRPGLPTPSSSGPPSPLDPEVGYDWITNTGAQHVLAVDREYACTFPLTAPRDCTDTSDATVDYACDCPSSPGLTPEELPPICDPTTQTTQVGAKAYPTVRELEVAQLLGSQGFVASLCPIDVIPAAGETAVSDPLYGYNPAVNGIVDRLKGSLGAQCLPQALAPGSCGTVGCSIFVTLPSGDGELACTGVDGVPGLSVPPASALQELQAQQHATWVSEGSVGVDPSTLPTCLLQQLSQLPAGANAGSCPAPVGTFDASGSCAASPSPGWCYVTGAGAGACPQSIAFTNGEPPLGAIVTLQCVAP
jgi:hypothetical protein